MRIALRGKTETNMTNGQKIIELASRFAGLTEVRQNAKWDDKKTPGEDARAEELRQILRAAGHQDGWPYCASFCRAIWFSVYSCTQHKITVKKTLSASVMNSWEQVKKAGLARDYPVPGAIFFFRNGRAWTGHEGIVVEVGDGGKMRTIEGNTSPQPTGTQSDREGDGVYFRERNCVIQSPRDSGLYLVGFLHPF